MSFKNIMLSMDLSLSASGFAVLAVDTGGSPILLECTLVTTKGDSHGEKISQVIEEVERLIGEYAPEHLVREKSFSRFAAATQAIYKVNGVVDYVLWIKDGDIIDEVANSTAKKYVTGHGKSSKDQVAEGVFKMLQIENTDEYYRINRKGERILLDDKTDSIAVGLTHMAEKSLIKP